MQKLLNLETAARLHMKKELRKGHLKTKEQKDETAKTIREQLHSKIIDSRSTADLLTRSVKTHEKARRLIEGLDIGLGDRKDDSNHDRKLRRTLFDDVSDDTTDEDGDPVSFKDASNKSLNEQLDEESKK